MRFWLVGNGPSLNRTPLAGWIGDDYSIGVNKVAYFFPNTKWRPSFYVKVDHSEFGQDDWRDEVMPFIESEIPCLLWDGFRQELGERHNVTWVTRCEHHGEPPTSKKRAIHWHEPFCTAYNSISIMAQWAVKLGATEIRLVGCDGNFTDGKDDHFMPYYESVDVGYKDRNNSHVIAAHQLIKDSCPVPVLDFTLGGGIGLFPNG